MMRVVLVTADSTATVSQLLRTIDDLRQVADVRGVIRIGSPDGLREHDVTVLTAPCTNVRERESGRGLSARFRDVVDANRRIRRLTRLLDSPRSRAMLADTDLVVATDPAAIRPVWHALRRWPALGGVNGTVAALRIAREGEASR